MQRRLVPLLMLFVLLIGGLCFFVPHTFAATVIDPSTAVGSQNPGSGGIVPAGKANYGPAGYGPCELIDLVNNVLRFLVAISSVIAVIIFMYAGFLFVTSQGNEGTIGRAKSMFTNVVIGFVIMLSSYLIVNTVLTVLAGGTPTLTSWSSLPASMCAYENQVGTAVYHVDLTSAQVQAIYASTSPALIQATKAGSCDSTMINQVWGSNLSRAANCIITNESACGANPFSKTDHGADGNTFSFGAMQINTTVHNVSGCQAIGIPDLPCTQAWSGTNYGAVVVNQSLYNQCKDALLNPQCNMIVGKQIFQQAGNSFKPWSTAAGCGLQ